MHATYTVQFTMPEFNTLIMFAKKQQAAVYQSILETQSHNFTLTH
jgi:hypothetical protein